MEGVGRKLEGVGRELEGSWKELEGVRRKLEGSWKELEGSLKGVGRAGRETLLRSKKTRETIQGHIAKKRKSESGLPCRQYENT